MKKRLLSALLTVVLLCSLLSGCYSIIMEDFIYADGTVYSYTALGLSEEYYKSLYEINAELGTDITFDEYMEATAEADELVPYTYNGVTYWGAAGTTLLSSVEEYNKERFGNTKGDNSLVVDENGDFTLTLTFNKSDIAERTGRETDYDSLTEEEIASVREEFPVSFVIHLPDTIGRVRGNTNCFSIDDNVITIDTYNTVLEMEGDSLTFQFSTADPTFIDTPVTAWYTAAAEAMAAGGLMAGVGEGRFSPDSDLTVGELAQILARATGLDVGTGESGYWAEIAIQSCLAKGYITDRGEATQANYGVPVDRQEAIAAMQRASGREPTGTLTAADIPDFASIKDEFKQDILDAYNSGVTAGMDENRTCGPNLSLTRAQVAQLFYALGWTAPLA